MHQATVCPGCSVQFKVTAAQLMVHGGDVRCGRCQHIFNAYKHLVTVADTKAAPTNAPAGYRHSAVDPSRAAAETSPLPAASQHSERSFGAAVMLRSEADADLPVARSPVAPRSPSRPASPPPATAPFGRRLLVAALVLALSVAVVLARHEIASRYPGLKAPLATLLSPLGMPVHFVQDATQVKLVSSGLEQEEDVASMQLVFLIQNTADYWLSYPDVRLVLLDATDQVLEERIIPPSRYASLDPRGLAPGGEWEARVHFQPRQPGVAGYRILLQDKLR